MEDLIKGEFDWHNKVNDNFHELSEKAGVIITEENIPVEQRKKGAVYFVVTDQAPTENNTIKVSPTIGIKQVEEG
ncbi:hypothetical protein [Clostridium sp.]|uniref:hypothetical protein n=1 Tax=Clostridium sp. TaxID=1506 RepID=UPI0035A1309A